MGGPQATGASQPSPTLETYILQQTGGQPLWPADDPRGIHFNYLQ